MVYNIDDESVPIRLNIPERNTTFQVKIYFAELCFKHMFQICVRDANYKLIWGRKSMLSRNYRKIRNRVPEETLELYNLETDPGETTNIASSYPQVVADLKQFGLSNYEQMIPPAMGLHTWVIVSFIAIILKYSRQSCSNQTLIASMAVTMDGAKR